MASINYAAREISVKIVYYGPGLSGKTTNLQVIHRKVPPEFKSDMVSLATETDRTLFFDFLPLDLGKIKGFSTKFQLYTVPGQVYYNATRKLVLRGVDGVVFVADSGADKVQENLESFQNLEENLAEYGYQRESIPIIIQYNKRDLPNALTIDELQQLVNKYNLPWSEAIANKGKGVFDSLKLIGKIVIDYLNRKYSRQPRSAGSQEASAAAARQQAAAPQQPQFQQRPAQAAAPRFDNNQGGGFQAPRQQQPQQVTRPPVQQQPQYRQPAPAQQQHNAMQQPPRQAVPPRQTYAPPQQQQFAPRPQVSPTYDDAESFEPAQNARSAPYVPPQNQGQSEEYMGYGNISLEPMGSQPAPVQRPAPQQQQYAPPSQVQDYEDQSAGQQGKTDLDLEIEKYQREIEEKQRKTRTQPPPMGAPRQSMPPQTPSPAPVQRQPIAPPAPQPMSFGQGIPGAAPQRGGMPPRPAVQQSASQDDYDAINVEMSQAPVPPPSRQQSQPQQPAAPAEDGDDMYFTSVNPDRQRKPIKKPVNPRNKPQKGFLSKLFNRENP